MRATALEGQFGYFAPLGAVGFAANENRKRWQLAAEAGVWWNQKHGEVTITADDISHMAANFKNGKFPTGAQQLPIDFEHLSIKENRKPGDGAAAGWIEDVDVRDDGRQLWALIDWTEDGASAIEQKKYKGFSPLFHPNWKGHGAGAKPLGVTLLGGALTNYQTIPNCVVSFSLERESSVAIRGLASFEDLSFSERERRVREAIEAKYPPAFKDGGLDWSSYVNVRDVKDDIAYFSRGARIFAVKYSVDEDLSITFDGDAFEVTVDYKAVVEMSAEGTMKIKNAKGEEIEIPAESFKALSLDALSEIPAVKDLRAKADAKTAAPTADVEKLNATVIALSGTVDTLKTSLDTTTAALDAEKAKTKAAEEKALDQDLASLAGAGRLLPAEVPHFKALALANPALYGEMIKVRREAATPIVRLNTEAGSSGAAGEHSAIVAFDNAVAEYKTKNPTKGTADAIMAVQQEKPELATARNQAMRLSAAIGPGGVALAMSGMSES